jgi:SAM-dependent methyltransferase
VHLLKTPAVCDYEGSNYRTDFWEGKGRDYEDAVERVALRTLLPRQGQRYVEFGAGFGRLINEAGAFDQVVLVDYSRTLLQDAQSRLGRSGRYVYVAADLYRLPFAPNAFDMALMCRVIHHLADAPAALKQIHDSLTPHAHFILEFANKQNLKAILRYALRLQPWSPYDTAPLEFVKLNFDFHPRYIATALQSAGFISGRRLAVSSLRLGLFKSILPLGLMVGLDRLIQPTGAFLPISPSLWVENRVAGQPQPVASLDHLFKCPICGSTQLNATPELLTCEQNHRWAIHDGIYDFKDPI